MSVTPADYLEFARSVAADLAERLPVGASPLKRGRRRQELIAGGRCPVWIRGRHITYVGQWNFRGSDARRRLQLIVAALERYVASEGTARGRHARACRFAAALLLQGNESLEDRQLLTLRPELRADPVFRPMRERWRARFLLGRKGRKPRDSGKRVSELERLAHIIRSEVHAYRKRGVEPQRDFERAFARWYGDRVLNHGLRYGRCDNPAWFDEQEAAISRHVEELHRMVAPAGPGVARIAAAWLIQLARLRHIRGSYREAERAYREALGLYRGPLAAEPTNRLVLPWLRMQISCCRRAVGPTAIPTLLAGEPGGGS